MKKITFFIAALSSGGAEHQLSILANLLDEYHYSVEIITYSDKEDHYFLNPNIRRIRLAPKKRKLTKLLSMLKFFRRNKTDVIISFGSRDNTLATLFSQFNKQSKLIVSERCVMYKDLTWYQKLNYTLFYRYTDAIVANSHTQAAQISCRYPYLKSKTLTITNYTDLTQYTTQEATERNEKTIRIGIFSRFVEQKNYKRFAEAVREIKNRSNKNFKIMWYGNIGSSNNPNQNYIEFQRLIKEYEIENFIELRGHIKETSNIIHLFDVLCLPSLTEGFSNSISEYICCGKPVLCSDVADNKYLVRDSYNGYLFNPYDIEDITEKFIKFFNLSDDERLSMSRRSREIAESLFDREAFVKSYINLIES